MPKVLSVTSLTLVNCAAAETVDTFRKEHLEVQGMDRFGGCIDREGYPGYTGIIAGRFHFSHISAWKIAKKLQLLCISILYVSLGSRMFY